MDALLISGFGLHAKSRFDPDPAVTRAVARRQVDAKRDLLEAAEADRTGA